MIQYSIIFARGSNPMGTHYKGTKAEVRALDAYIKLMRSVDAIQVGIERNLAAAGITDGQLGVLEALLHLGPLCQRDLGVKLFYTGGNVTMIVDNLEKRGFVERVRDT